MDSLTTIKCSGVWPFGALTFSRLTDHRCLEILAVHLCEPELAGSQVAQ